MAEYLRRIVHRVVDSLNPRTAESTFLVTCKSCGRNVPVGIEEFPFHSIAVACRLCGHLQSYRPSEIIFGVADELVRMREQRKPPRIRSKEKTALIGLFR